MAEGLEFALDDIQKLAGLARDTAARLAKHAAEVEKLAKQGQLKGLREARARLAEYGRDSQDAALKVAEAWPWSTDEEEERFLQTSYGAELSRLAEAKGIRCYAYDGGWSAFPVLIRLDAAGRSLRIDRKRTKFLSPSVVVDLIAAARRAKPRQTPERFIEILYIGYRSALGANALEGQLFRADSAVQLVDVYRRLTPLPDARKDYPIEEFQRDIHQLNMSGVRATKARDEVYFSAATGTKGAGRSVLTVIDEHATPHQYFAVSFRAVER